MADKNLSLIDSIAQDAEIGIKVKEKTVVISNKNERRAVFVLNKQQLYELIGELTIIYRRLKD